MNFLFGVVLTTFYLFLRGYFSAAAFQDTKIFCIPSKYNILYKIKLVWKKLVSSQQPDWTGLGGIALIISIRYFGLKYYKYL